MRAAVDAVSVASQTEADLIKGIERNGDLRPKVEAFEIARKTLKDHVTACPQCASEGNAAV